MSSAWLWGTGGQVAAVVLGAVLGSFLNVVRVRLPEGRSLVTPPSSCPSCGERVRPWDNVPILSWILLRGRCRFCRHAISWHYPVVEALGAAVLWFAHRTASTPLDLVFTGLFALSLLVILFIDLEHQIIPDVITIPGTLIGIAAGIWIAPGVLERALGAAAGGLGLLALAWGYKAATGVSGMGMGDVKMMAMVGAFLGWPGAAAVVLLGSLGGSLVGVLLLVFGRAHRRTLLPFGSFLAPAAWIVLFWGEKIWAAYLGLWNVLGG